VRACADELETAKSEQINKTFRRPACPSYFLALTKKVTKEATDNCKSPMSLIPAVCRAPRTQAVLAFNLRTGQDLAWGYTRQTADEPQGIFRA
jgi:hypothetical protein